MPKSVKKSAAAPNTVDDIVNCLSDGQLEVLGELENAKEIARKFFEIDSAEKPTPEMVFGIYDRLFNAFDDGDEDDEDEDEDEDEDGDE
jgi:hypothetical protein